VSANFAARNLVPWFGSASFLIQISAVQGLRTRRTRYEKPIFSVCCVCSAAGRWRNTCSSHGHHERATASSAPWGRSRG
jgi:hypothetical protein